MSTVSHLELLLMIKMYSSQLMYKVLLVLVSFITILIWLMLGSSLFGYRISSVHGTSMQPNLYNGDAVLMKYTKSIEIEIGSIVSLQDPSEGWIIHRVIAREPFSKDSYLLKTRGDNNACPEFWIIGIDEKILVSQARFSRVGYILNFLGSIQGAVFLIVIVISLGILTWMRRTHKEIKEE